MLACWIKFHTFDIRCDIRCSVTAPLQSLLKIRIVGKKTANRSLNSLYRSYGRPREEIYYIHPIVKTLVMNLYSL